MRNAIAGILVAATAFALPAQAAGDECVACRYFEGTRINGGSTVFDAILLRLKQQPLAAVSLAGGVFCTTEPGASVANDLEQAADAEFSRASEIANKAKQCPQACASTLTEADYCAYGDRLFADRYRLGAVAVRLTDLTQLYERSANQNTPPLASLADDATQYGGEALSVVKQALQALEAANVTDVPDVRWQASATELAGLFGSVALLADFELITGDVAQLETALEKASVELSALRGDLTNALRQRKRMLPAEKLAFEERLLTGASNLAFAIASLQISAEAAGPVGSQDSRAAVGCFRKLSLHAITGSEAPDHADRILSACRSFATCPERAPLQASTTVSPLRAFLETREDAARLTEALLASMCKPG